MANSNTTKIVRNVNLNYAKVHKAVKNDYDKVIFDLQVEFPKERMAEMSEFGTIRESKLNPGMFCLNITRPEKNKDGKKNTIRVLDSEKNPLKADIGNGSVGNIMVYSFDWNFGGKSGRKTILLGVQVTDLVKYTPVEDFDIVASEGETTGEAALDF